MTPRSVVEVLEDPERRRAIVHDAAALVEAEVAAKRGLRGRALRAGFMAFKAVKPGILTEAVDRLLPHFAPVLDPLWRQAVASGRPEQWMADHAGEVAEGLLGVTDGLADRARNRVLRRIYRSLRGQARQHVVDAVPGLARLMAAHGIA